MSKPRTPFADVEVSLDKSKRAWIEKMLAAFGLSAPATKPAGPAQSAGDAPVLQGGVPVRQVEKLREQQAANVFSGKNQEDAARKAIAKTPPKPWTFEEAMKGTYENVPPVFQFPNRKPLILEADEHLGIRDNDYAKLPKDLKKAMTPEVWEKIKPQRTALITIYARLKEYGVWGKVTKVTGIKEQLPWHGQLGSLSFGAYGTGGIAFEEERAGGIAAKLVSDGNFGNDNKIMSAMHPGQGSIREFRGDLEESFHEWSEKAPTPTSSLHISVGPQNEFDAHIDRISPVTKPHEGDSVPSTNSVKHIVEEVIRPASKIPFTPIPKPPGLAGDITREKIPTGPRDSQKATTFWINFKIEWDFPSGNTKQRKKVYNPHPPRPEPPPTDVLEKIMTRAKTISGQFPKTSEGDIDADVLAEFIAASVWTAGKKGKSSISVDFPNYIDTRLSDAEQKMVHDAVQELGKIVSSELGQHAASVKDIFVHIPAHKGGNVPAKK